MGVLDFEKKDTLGTVESVDTSTVVIRVDSDEKIKGLQVNHLLAIQSPKVGQQLIGMVSKIIRKSTDSADIMDEFGMPLLSYNMIKVVLIGTHFDKEGIKLFIFSELKSSLKVATIIFVLALLSSILKSLDNSFSSGELAFSQ